MKIKILLLFFFLLLMQQIVNAQTPILFGLTSAYDGDSLGTIFRIDADGGNFNLLKKFGSTQDESPIGAEPHGSLIQASNGLLYGMAYYGGDAINGNFPEGPGVIFTYDPINNIYNVVYSLDGDHGAHPLGSLMEATDHKLYGMTSEGGSANLGVMFSINLDGTGYSDLVDFDGTNGFSPRGSLMQASNGLLYGMTSGNEDDFFGTIFSYDITSSAFNKFWDFDVNDPGNGAYPFGTLIEVDNTLYGMISQGGGDQSRGAIFSIGLDGSAYTNLVPFTGDACNHLGSSPNGSLIFANGYLFGTTANGGNAINNKKCILEVGLGTLFKYQIGDADVTYLHTFVFDGEDGVKPLADLVLASDGLLYGMTTQGGETGGGIIYSLSPDGDGSDYTKVYDFDNGGNAGGAPLGNLMEFIPPANPTISVNTPSAFCAGGNATLTAGCSANCTGITYSWAPSSGLSATTGTSVSASPSSTTTYTVTATNGSGSTASATSVVTINASPSAPSASAGTGATSSQITANWGSVGGATAYFLDVSTSNGFGSFVSGFNNLNVGNVLTKNVTGLTAGTTYFYRVRATNGSCTSANSGTITYATTGSGPGCPFIGGAVNRTFSIICSPNGQQALSVTGSTGNNYNWQMSSDNVSWTDISGATTTSYTTAAGDANSNKFYRLMSRSSTCWNVTSNTAEVDISNPTIALAATNITDNSITLNWSPTGTGNYTISYSGTSSATQTSVTPAKTITGLSSNGSYTIVVTQTGVSGCSASGTLTGVNTLCAMPTGVTLSSPANAQILVSWTGVGGADYRVYYRPLFAYGYFFTKDVSGVSSALITKQGNNNLYGNATYEVYVSRLDCPNPGVVGQGTNPTNVTTKPTLSCTTPVIDSVRSICPVQMEVFIHPGSSPTNTYNVYLQRLTPSILAVNSYGVTGNYFTINTPYSGSDYLIAVDSRCSGGELSTLYVSQSNLTLKPLCTSPANLVLSNPTCHGFTASWNGDQCLSNSASGYVIYLRVAGTINFNSYGVQLPSGGLSPYKPINWLTSGRNYQVFVRSIYNCNGFLSYGPSSQIQTIATLSSGCRDEETEQPEETKPAVQQYSADNQEIFSLYPNPNNGEFAVDLSRYSTDEDGIRIEVINMIGQTIVTHLTTITGGHMSEFINLPGRTPAGTYIVRLTAGKNVYTAKINVSK